MEINRTNKKQKTNKTAFDLETSDFMKLCTLAVKYYFKKPKFSWKSFQNECKAGGCILLKNSFLTF